MPPRPTTPFGDTATLGTGHWTQDQTYRNWRPQGTRDHLLIYTLNGSGRLRHASQTLFTAPGDLTLHLPHTPQDYRTARDPGTWELLWAHVHPLATWKPYLDWPEISPGLRRLHLNDPAVRRRVERCLKTMLRFDRSAQPLATELAMNALEAALLHATNASADRTRMDPRLRPVLDLIHRRFDQPLPIDQLAAAAHLSPSRFAHLFREQLGTTPQQYHQHQRLHRARQLLERTGLTIAQIAEHVGYPDPFYFSRRFRHAFGQSPRDHRKKHDAARQP